MKHFGCKIFMYVLKQVNQMKCVILMVIVIRINRSQYKRIVSMRCFHMNAVALHNVLHNIVNIYPNNSITTEYSANLEE